MFGDAAGISKLDVFFGHSLHTMIALGAQNIHLHTEGVVFGDKSERKSQVSCILAFPD